MHELNPLWIPILGILMPIVLVPLILMLKHRTLQREWQHKERMKAIEMGGSPPPSTAAGSVVAIGAGVPIASVLAAAVTSLSYQPTSAGDEVPVFGIAWGCAFLISILGMGSGLILAHIQGRAGRETESLHAIEGRQASLRSRRLRRGFEPRLIAASFCATGPRHAPQQTPARLNPRDPAAARAGCEIALRRS